MRARRRHSREFKLEAVKLVRERGVSMAQAARDLDIHVNLLRGWVCEALADPTQAFPGHGQQKPDDAEVTRLRREARARAELSQERLAFRAGIHPVSLGRVERGEKSPTLDVVDAIARALDVRPHALLRSEEQHL